ncbi:hypothetical protein [Nocardia brasiliensis]|uniref:hypothetical protein n=1 Tax=Nocardia brasiliensis TaxID=37326 RepID=UPI002458CEC4|nr:hypothetical protein [Nocardia brasiliensis]
MPSATAELKLASSVAAERPVVLATVLPGAVAGGGGGGGGAAPEGGGRKQLKDGGPGGGPARPRRGGGGGAPPVSWRPPARPTGRPSVPRDPFRQCRVRRCRPPCRGG